MDLSKLRLKDYIIIFLKGILLGLVSVGVPGVSASTIGIIIGIYFIMVDAIANIMKNFKHNFIFLIFLIGGYAIGSVGAAFSVTILFEKYPMVTTFVILGFIVACIPDMFIKLKKHLKKPSCWITFAIVLVILFVYNMTISTGMVKEFPDDPDLGYLIYMGIIGIITSATFVVPGVDFAVVFLSLGIYYPFMNMITEILSFGMDNYFASFVGNIQILGVYLAGYFIGVFLFSKLIKFLSTRYDAQTQFGSFAFIVAAPFIVIKNCILDNESFRITKGQTAVVIVACIVAFASLATFKIISRKKQAEKLAEQEAIESSLLQENTIDNENIVDKVVIEDTPTVQSTSEASSTEET